jgi:hypothetical protein
MLEKIRVIPGQIPRNQPRNQPMKLPLWYKDQSGKYITLEHYPDGNVGISTDRLLSHDRSGSVLHFADFTYDVAQDRYLLRHHVLNPIKEQQE